MIILVLSREHIQVELYSKPDRNGTSSSTLQSSNQNKACTARKLVGFLINIDQALEYQIKTRCSGKQKKNSSGDPNKSSNNNTGSSI